MELAARFCVAEKKYPTGHMIKISVSENGGFSPQIIHFHMDFHSKSSILGVFPKFLETPKTDIIQNLRSGSPNRTASLPALLALVLAYASRHLSEG